SVRLTDGNQAIIMGTKLGMSIHFHESDVRQMGRTARGVKGITLSEGDTVIDMDIVDPQKDMLIVTQNGYGKRTKLDEYRVQSRGGKGIKTLNVTPKKGKVLGHAVVADDDD